MLDNSVVEKYGRALFMNAMYSKWTKSQVARNEKPCK